MQTSHHKPAVEQSNQTDLQRDALHYLKEFGPLNWGALYVRFNEAGSGDIGPALLDLQEQQYIEVRSDSIVKITPLGVAQLNAGHRRSDSRAHFRLEESEVPVGSKGELLKDDEGTSSPHYSMDPASHGGALDH